MAIHVRLSLFGDGGSLGRVSPSGEEVLAGCYQGCYDLNRIDESPHMWSIMCCYCGLFPCNSDLVDQLSKALCQLCAEKEMVNYVLEKNHVGEQ